MQTMNFDFSGIYFFIAFVAALVVTVLAVALKLCGVLLLSWWWVCAPVPALVLLVVIIAGLGALFD